METSTTPVTGFNKVRLVPWKMMAFWFSEKEVATNTSSFCKTWLRKEKTLLGWEVPHAVVGGLVVF
jgi:hypothetical protein